MKVWAGPASLLVICDLESPYLGLSFPRDLVGIMGPVLPACQRVLLGGQGRVVAGGGSSQARGPW